MLLAATASLPAHTTGILVTSLSLIVTLAWLGYLVS